MAGDLNPKHQFGKTADSNVSGEAFWEFFYVNDLEISVPLIPTYFCPMGNGILLDIAFCQKEW
jgi:hypothetical protein